MTINYCSIFFAVTHLNYLPVMQKISIEDIEKTVIPLLIAQAGEYADSLLKQYEMASIFERTYSGVGFFTDFQVDDPSLRLPSSISTYVGDVTAQVSGLIHGAGFILHIQNGLLDFLECYTFEGSWPDEIYEFSIDHAF